MKTYILPLSALLPFLANAQLPVTQTQVELTALKATSLNEKSKPIGDIDKIKFNNYFQFQFRDTDQAGKTQHGFEVRRARLGMSMDINERASVRASYDIAGGTARSSGEPKDIVLTYRPGQEGLSIIGGQFPLPLGYETATSNNALEFPERDTVNRTLFNDERIRGVMVQQQLEGGASVYAGVSNS